MKKLTEGKGWCVCEGMEVFLAKSEKAERNVQKKRRRENGRLV